MAAAKKVSDKSSAIIMGFNNKIYHVEMRGVAFTQAATSYKLQFHVKVGRHLDALVININLSVESDGEPIVETITFPGQMALDHVPHGLFDSYVFLQRIYVGYDTCDLYRVVDTLIARASKLEITAASDGIRFRLTVADHEYRTVSPYKKMKPYLVSTRTPKPRTPRSHPRPTK